MRKHKNETGITLIALTITIIVLLILAGVTITAISEDNGILQNAARAKEESEKAEIIEQIRLDITDKQIENEGSIDEDEFYKILGKYGTVAADETILTTTKGNYEILISDIYSGNIETSLVTTPIESWEYTISGTNVILTKYIGLDTKIYVPDTFFISENNYNSILAVSSSTNNTGPFYQNKVVEYIKFGDNVEIQTGNAYVLFNECSNLKKVYNFPKNVTSLQSTFQLCTALINIPEIPTSVTNMLYTFYGCTNLSGTIIINSDNVNQVDGCFLNRNQEIILKVNKESLTYEIFSDMMYSWDNVKFQDENYVNIACWGDSLTVGAGGGSTSYPTVLRSVANNSINVTKLGVGGENSTSIAIRQGGIPIYANSFTIPEDKEAVQIQISQSNGESVRLLGQGTSGVNPCFINNVKGTLTRSGSDYYFTREDKGKAVMVEEGTQIITDGMINHKNDLMIIWAGTNDRLTSKNVSETIENIKSMLEFSDNPNYIVIGMTSKYSMSEIEEINELLYQEFEEHFLDIRGYLLNESYLSSEYGITLTDTDKTDITNGEIPTSLRSDDIHLNEQGYTIVGTEVYTKLNLLGYIT